MTDDKTRQLENRIDKLEATIEKMMPSRRDALKMGGAALAGGSLMAGTASAGTNQVGTIGSASQPVDLESEDINNADTVTTKDLVVNGTATGPFGGGVVLEAGDTITVEAIRLGTTDESFVNLYDGVAKDVLGGTLSSGFGNDFLYEFSDSTKLHKNGTGTTYTRAKNSAAQNANGDRMGDIDFLPPAKDVVKIDVGVSIDASREFGAEVILKD